MDRLLSNTQLDVIKNRLKQLGPEEMDEYLRTALIPYPELYLLHFGEKPPEGP